MDTAKSFLFEQFDCILKMVLLLTGKADNDIGGQRHIGNFILNLANFLAILAGGIPPSHAFKDLVISRLERDMKEWTKLWIGCRQINHRIRNLRDFNRR